MVDGYAAEGNREALEHLRSFISEVGLNFPERPYSSFRSAAIMGRDCVEKIDYIEWVLEKMP